MVEQREPDNNHGDEQHDGKKQQHSKDGAEEGTTSSSSSENDEAVLDVEHRLDAASAKDFILHVFSGAATLTATTGWAKLSVQWQSDHEIAAAALASHSVAARDLPTGVRSDRHFMMAAVAIVPAAWYALPPAFQADPAFARAIKPLRYDEDLATAVLERIPALRGDCDFWTLQLIPSLPHKLYALVERFASAAILADRDVALLACRRDPEVYRLLRHLAVRHEHDFVEVMVTSDCQRCPAWYLAHETQCRWPDLVARSFAWFQREARRRTVVSLAQGAACVAPILWRHRRVRTAWFQAGGAFVDACFPGDWKRDREVFWMIARCATDAVSVHSYASADASLTGDRGFMLPALEFNAHLYFLASDELQRDADFAVAALASASPYQRSLHGMARRFLALENGPQAPHHPNFVSQLRLSIREQLVAHETFTTVLLPGVSLPSGATTTTTTTTQDDNTICSSLALLRQGMETEVGLKRLIADFVGVPTGSTLRRLRRASLNLPEPIKFVMFD